MAVVAITATVTVTATVTATATVRKVAFRLDLHLFYLVVITVVL